MPPGASIVRLLAFPVIPRASPVLNCPEGIQTRAQHFAPVRIRSTDRRPSIHAVVFPQHGIFSSVDHLLAADFRPFRFTAVQLPPEIRLMPIACISAVVRQRRGEAVDERRRPVACSSKASFDANGLPQPTHHCGI
jgi:hypothetical protein